MKKLELHHLAPYLPYALKGKYTLSDVISLQKPQKDEIRDKLLIDDNVKYFLKYCKPILYPLSWLTKEIEHKIKLSPSGALHNENPYWVFQYAFEHHFDVFNLISSNLAIKKT